MRQISRPIRILATLVLAATLAAAQPTQSPAEKAFPAPRGQAVSIKMIGPVTQATDLQILCILKHDPAGDKYIEAMDDLNTKLGGLLSGVRDSGEFSGDLGETLLFTPKAGTIAPKRVLLIGVGAEENLTLDTLKLVGRIAAREAVRLNTAHVSFAPTLRDQGSSRVDVGAGDAAFAAAWVLAYDTEKKLQEQGFAPASDVSALVIEAGPKFFDGAAEKVARAVATAAEELKVRSSVPFGK